MSIRLEQLVKRYTGLAAVDDISLEVTDGELFVLLGPSGSGKSTVLRIIAGLARPDGGRVLLGGRDVTDLPPQHRNVGMVFQNYSLFRNMTVAQNIEFGLEVRHVARAARKARREELLDLIGMTGLADRYPQQLSGGQMQRVAVARALAFDPSVLLLDEPFGALDVRIRAQLRRSFKRIQRRLGVTTILVTHDQDEAFELADRIGVVDQGRLLELGDPQTLYRHPRTEFVARFLGNAALLNGRLESGRVRLGPVDLSLPDLPGGGADDTEGHALPSSEVVAIMFRPEDLEVAADLDALKSPVLGRAVVTNVEFRGALTRVEAALEPQPGVRALEADFGEQAIPLEVSVLPTELERGGVSAGCPAWVGVRGFHVLARTAPRVHLAFHSSFAPQVLAGTIRVLARMENLDVTVMVVGATAKEADALAATASKLVPTRKGWALEQRVADDWLRVALADVREGPYDMMVTHAADAATADRIARLAAIPALILRGERPALARALVCTAGGEPGKVDVLVAARVVRRLQAAATLLYVGPVAERDEARELVRRHLDQGAETLRVQGILCDTKVRFGEVVPEILQEAREGDYDLVVVGGHLPPARRAFGERDVAAMVAAAADRTVLVVRGALA